MLLLLQAPLNSKDWLKRPVYIQRCAQRRSWGSSMQIPL
jgi:hypothetical protein